LSYGKVPPETLEKIVFKRLGAKRSDVILGPAAGEDGAIIEVGDKLLVSTVDPITGATERLGWLAVNICANDVATFGVRPSFYSSCILLPENYDEKTLETISAQIGQAAEKLGIAVVGGHTEVTPGLTHPIVVGQCMGVTEKDRYVTSGGAKPGDTLILTKSVGLEGTAILAADRYELLKKNFRREFLESAKSFFDRISVVEEAVLAFETGGVNAMHDPTEGGVAGGIHELADASKVGVRIFEDKVPIAKETLEICKFFKIDPLQLISSGALLIATKPGFAEKIVERLTHKGIEASIIGEVLDSIEDRLLVLRNGTEKKLVRPESDHLWQALEFKNL